MSIAPPTAITTALLAVMIPTALVPVIPPTTAAPPVDTQTHHHPITRLISIAAFTTSIIVIPSLLTPTTVDDSCAESTLLEKHSHSISSMAILVIPS